jgi:hypothetical protein
MTRFWVPGPILVIVFAFVSVLAAILIALVATHRPGDTEPSSIGEAEGETAAGHVHGLGVDPSDQTLYVATHFGVVRMTDDGPERVAERWQDTMGFAVIGPRHFLASGHPDLRDRRTCDAPAHQRSAHTSWAGNEQTAT